MEKIVILEESERHFTLACKMHYGDDRERALIRIYKHLFLYGENDTIEDLKHRIGKKLLRIIHRYNILNDHTDGFLEFMEKLVDPSFVSPYAGMGVSERCFVACMNEIANWQVSGRKDGFKYELGNTDPKYL